MRILSVHNEYLIKGGEDESRRAETAVLAQYGHDVPSYVETNTRVANFSKGALALRTLWSQESYRVIRQRLRAQRHNVVHVQNFFPLISPAVYYAARAEGVPVVQAVRNYRLLCPSALLYRNGHVCELCVKKALKTDAVRYGCYRDNRAASAVATSMLALHNLLPTWQLVDRFVSVSAFVRQKLIEGGFPAERIVVKPNFVFPDPGPATEKDDYVVYVGRLQPEKGILTLLDAMTRLPGVPLKIIGEGPLLPDVLAAAGRNPNIQYVGKQPLATTYELIGRARALVIPSVWHEPFGRVVVEAYAKGTPVIGSRMGGIPELIQDGTTGYTVPAADPDALAERIDALYAQPELAHQMGVAGRQEYLTKYTPAANYAMLMAIYHQVAPASIPHSVPA